MFSAANFFTEQYIMVEMPVQIISNVFKISLGNNQHYATCVADNLVLISDLTAENNVHHFDCNIRFDM